MTVLFSFHVGVRVLVLQAVAIVDVLCSFASVASSRNYCRPMVLEPDLAATPAPTASATPTTTTATETAAVKDNTRRLVLKEARHAWVEAQEGVEFVANDVDLSASGVRLGLVTGPNMVRTELM